MGPWERQRVRDIWDEWATKIGEEMVNRERDNLGKQMKDPYDDFRGPGLECQRGSKT